MKPSFTLTGIVDFGTIGDDHLSGEARFSDGKRYRFVINSEMDYSGRTQAPTRKAPAVLKMALPYMPVVGYYGKPPEEQWAWGNDHRVFPKRAALIMRAYPAYLERAKVEKATHDAAEDHANKMAQKAYLLDKALKDAAPELLEALQLMVVRFSRRWCSGENLAREAALAKSHAAITKATTIPQSN